MSLGGPFQVLSASSLLFNNKIWKDKLKKLERMEETWSSLVGLFKKGPIGRAEQALSRYKGQYKFDTHACYQRFRCVLL